MGPSFEPSPTGLRRAWTFVVLMGVVSLLADMTYEGARSLLGPFLGTLGAGAAVVGLTAGLGEFVGYALRLLTGALADRTRGYWALTLGGYGLNLLAVPALALVGRWEAALGLVVLERLGKAIRTPARDALLSRATARLGHGRGFGLHETLDQIGAVLGPLLVAFVFFQTGSYRATFGGLAVPALLALGALLGARRLFPSVAPSSASAPAAAADPGPERRQGLPRALGPYAAFVGLSALGFVNFPLIAYHLKATEAASETTIALMFALTMGTDALVAYPLGWLFDRWGRRALAFAPLFALPVAPLVFGDPFGLRILGLLFWGGRWEPTRRSCGRRLPR